MHTHEARWLRAGVLSLLFGLGLIVGSAVKATPGDTLYVHDNNVNVYLAPNVDAQVLMRLDQGHKLKELRRQGGWVKVIIYGEIGKDGWVEQSHLGSKPPLDGTAESQESDEDAIVGAIKTPKPKAKSLLHSFQFSITGTGRIKGRCRYITESGAERRFKLGIFVNTSYRIEAKAIRCSVRSTSTGARVTVKYWEDGEFRGSKTIRSRGLITIKTPWDWN